MVIGMMVASTTRRSARMVCARLAELDRCGRSPTSTSLSLYDHQQHDTVADRSLGNSNQRAPRTVRCEGRCLRAASEASVLRGTRAY